MQSCALKQKTKHIEGQELVLPSKTKCTDRRMVKQKACGVILALCGLIPTFIEKDATAFIFISFFFLPMIFWKRYILIVNESNRTNNNT